MKYLKTQNLSKFNIQDDTFKVQHPSGQVTINSKDSILLPKGELYDRTYYPFEGMVRYTTNDTSQHEIADIAQHYPNVAIGLEIYHEGRWLPIRSAEPARIVKQNLGVGNYDVVTQPVEELSQYFPTYDANRNHTGMTYVPGLAHGKDPQDYIDNMIVVVENVIQISGTNYELYQSPGEIVGFAITSAGSSDHTTMTISVSTSDSTGAGGSFTANLDGSPGALDSVTVADGGTGFNDASLITVTATGDGATNPTLEAYVLQPGWHLKLLSAVPDTKPVHVFFGYDQ